MAAVVQATCPGCKNVLRIPADWAHEPVRCKKCGTVLQAKQPPPPGRPRTTPPPAPARRGPPPPPLPPPAPPAPPGQRPAAAVVASTSPFDFQADERPSPRRRRRRRGSGWLGLGVLAAVLVLAGVATAVFWPKLRPLLAELSGKPTTLADAAGPDTGSQAGGKEKGDGGKPDGDGSRNPPPPGTAYPRRALVISVHNYLYANPINEGDPSGKQPNLVRFLEVLRDRLHVHSSQFLHLSDSARGQPRPPTKPLIERVLKEFLEGSRKQDRVMVFFIGHSAEVRGEAYLAPVEGELDTARTLIPLKWVYEQLAKCAARQKVLVLDVNRLNPGQGLERPASGPMGTKFDEVLKAPPAGVQVWSACVAGQQSYQTDTCPGGVFLDQLRYALAPPAGKKGALEGRIQQPDDLVPVGRLNEAVNKGMAEELGRRKLKQQARVTGEPPATGAGYDRDEPLAALPSLPPARGGDERVLRNLLAEVNVPPIKGEGDDLFEAFRALPVGASPEVLKKYEDEGDPDSKLKAAVRKARVVLWAVSTAKAPPALAQDVAKVRKELKVDLGIMRDRYTAPAPGPGELKFKERVFEDGREMARIVLKLQETVEELKAVKKLRKKEPKRWQANYDFVLARLLRQVAYLEEYQSLLGQMRKEFPPRDPELHSGWRLASSTTMQGDQGAKRPVREAKKVLTALADQNPGTPWEVLAKREALTALGLEWQPAG